MLSARYWSLVVFFLIINSFLTTALSQTKDKINHTIIICPEPNCGFATYAYDTTQIPLNYLNHRLFMHNKETTIGVYKSLRRYQTYSSDIPEIKRIHCPLCDNYVEWSKDMKELKFNLKFHTTLVHNLKIKEDEIDPLID